MSEMDNGGTLASPEEATGESRVEVIDVQATVGKYLQSLVDDPRLQRISSSYVPVRLVPASGAGTGSQSNDGGGDSGSQAALQSTADLLACLDSWERIVLLGGPGGGKSATLRWLAFQQAGRVLRGGEFGGQARRDSS